MLKRDADRIARSDESLILNALQVEGRVYLARPDAFGTYYYFIELDNGRCLLVKRVATPVSFLLEASEKIAVWLYERGCCVCPLMDRILLEVEGRSDDLWVYWYTPGRPCEATAADLALLGHSLAYMHQRLRRNPQVIEWSQQTQEQYHALNTIRSTILASRNTRYTITDAVYHFLSNIDFSYFFNGHCQPLHGNLHTSHFFITLDKNICFFDFSHVSHSFEPIMLELAYVIDQCILSDITVKSERDAIMLGLLLLQNYENAGGCCVFQEKDQYALHFLLLKSFCALLFYEQEKKMFYPKEWDRLLVALAELPDKSRLLSTMVKTYQPQGIAESVSV